MPTQRIGTQINTPERAGATEPILVATTEQTAGGKSTHLVPVADRVEAAAARAAR